MSNRFTCKVCKTRGYFLLLLFCINLLSCNTLSDAGDSSDVLLEISVSLVEGDNFNPGDSFHAIVEIRNREAQGRIDVVVTYDVMGLDDGVVLSDTKTVAVETKSSFAEEFALPAWIDEGTYVLTANVSTLDGSKWSETGHSFSVVRISEDEQHVIEYIMLVALIFTGGGLFFEHRRISKLKVSGRDLKKFIDKQKK